ncbi:hypothetical protein AB4099_09875 [Bosea sp. 2KB_26]|uniref:hypothetical protein n=1 Tax=Bosea sp. 2KB_26 TaxID=3237475 RepID=UPI000DE40C6C
MRRFLITATIVIGAAATMAGLAPAAQASEAIAPAIAQQLDRQPLAFAMTDAKRERLMIIQDNMNRQRYYGRRDGYSHGYGYGRRHGGPPPWAPAHGYRRHHYERW